MAVSGELVELGPDASLRHAALGSQLDETLLLHVNAIALLAEGVVQEPDVGLLVGHSDVDLPDHAVDVGGIERQGLVVRLDGSLDLVSSEVWEVAEALLAATAEEVGVQRAVSAHGLCVDQAALAAHGPTAAAEHHPLEVVGQDAVTLSACAASGQDVLHLVKQRLLDQWLVPPLDDLALIGHEADVVRVTEHGVELAVGHRLGGPLGGWARGEAQLCQGIGQALQREVATGVQLEGLAHKWRT